MESSAPSCLLALRGGFVQQSWVGRVSDSFPQPCENSAIFSSHRSFFCRCRPCASRWFVCFLLQLAWLKESLTNSTAVWKIIATSVPMSIPTGPGDTYRDGWANFDGDTGYEQEVSIQPVGETNL